MPVVLSALQRRTWPITCQSARKNRCEYSVKLWVGYSSRAVFFTFFFRGGTPKIFVHIPRSVCLRKREEKL